MTQPSKKMINLPVFTESGQLIGRLADFNIDTDSQSILEYLVQTDRPIVKLLGRQLIVKRGQVVDILSDKIIVLDNTVKNKSKTTKGVLAEQSSVIIVQ